MFDVERVRQSWGRESATIDAVVFAINAHTAAEPIRGDGWSAHDLVGHIATSARAFLAYISGTRTEAFDRDAVNEQQRQRGKDRAWEDVQAYWGRARDEVAQFLDQTTSDMGDDPVALPWLPDVKTKGEALRILILHTRSHRQELEQGLPDVQA